MTLKREGDRAVLAVYNDGEPIPAADLPHAVSVAGHLGRPLPPDAPARLAAALIMGISLIVEYLFSTLYHALAPEKAKAVFRVLDHCGIYLLIAGSYAPFSLVTLADRGGLLLCCAVWAVAVVGIVAECLLRERQPAWLTAAVYVLMGWLVVFHIGDLWELLAPPAFWLLLAGGLSYTVGAVFYAIKKVPYLHFVFHLFTLAGSVCITLSALLFVV